MNTIPALTKILSTPDIGKAIETLARWAESASHRLGLSIYLLSTQRAAFVCQFGPQKDSVRKTNDFVQMPDRQVLSKRQHLLIGFIEWGEAIAEISTEECAAISAALEEIYRRSYVGNYFQYVRQPVDFTNQETYFRETAKLLSNTLSMEMVAIRQINSLNSLECRVFFHYPDHFGHRVDFEWDTMPLPFREVIEETQHALAQSATPILEAKFEEVTPGDTQRYGFLATDGQLENVKAFVVFPIVFGGEFFGVASCSTTAAFSFSALEKTAIQTAMQLVGIAISNFTKYHEAKRMTDVVHDQLFSVTQLEITHSARHELQNIEAEQALLVDELRDITRNIRDKVIPELVVKLNDSVLRLAAATRKLRYTGIHATPVLKSTSVKHVWEEALDLMKERLSTMGIKPKYVGTSNLDGHFYPEWLKEAFLNLLLNSIDAFRDRPKQNRQISLVVQKESEASPYHILDYSDNAGGIAFARLVIPDPIREANPGMELDQMIFQPRVTSKKNRQGAGWGLYLVRQALRLHNSSISLRANSKEGCTFRIQLRKDLREQQKH